MVKIVVGILVCDERDSTADGGCGPAGRGMRLLVTRRLDEAVLGGCWEFPGGKVEAGEAAAEALRREFLEEVGLEVEVGEALPAVEHVYPHAAVRIEPFWCRPRPRTPDPRTQNPQPRNLAVAEHRWVTVDELDALHFPPANGPLLAAIRQAFSGADSSDGSASP